MAVRFRAAAKPRRARRQVLVGERDGFLAIEIDIDQLTRYRAEQHPNVALAAKIPLDLVQSDADVRPAGEPRRLLAGGEWDRGPAAADVEPRGLERRHAAGPDRAPRLSSASAASQLSSGRASSSRATRPCKSSGRAA